MWIYTGQNGEFIPGVPQRDLSADEFASLENWQKDAIYATGLYLWQEIEQ